VAIIQFFVILFYNTYFVPHHLFIFDFLLTHMPKAFVLMNAELGSEDAIVGELKRLDGVKEVYQVYGVYDIVAQVESDTMEKVKETITWKLRKLNGVKSTLTMIVME
jgi:DNA-binding Lrp family transcriptional regulator